LSTKKKNAAGGGVVDRKAFGCPKEGRFVARAENISQTSAHSSREKKLPKGEGERSITRETSGQEKKKKG